ncbi:endonuclease/exonuclease/phosphatase family protein [Streptomyces sp. INA 01156]
MPHSSRRPVRGARTAAPLTAAVAVMAVVLATATPAAAGPSGAGPAVPLRVATYNIHAGACQDGVFDLDRTAEALRGLDADVIGLQEVDVHWGARSDFVDEARALADALDMRVFFAPIYDLDPATADGERRQYGVAVLAAPGARGREPRDHPALHQTSDPVPAPAPGFAEVTVDVKGVFVHVYSTHLDHRADPSIRAAQVADMLEALAADHGPKILVGDFNAEATAPELAPLWRRLRTPPRTAVGRTRRSTPSSASTW